MLAPSGLKAPDAIPTVRGRKNLNLEFLRQPKDQIPDLGMNFVVQPVFQFIDQQNAISRIRQRKEDFKQTQDPIAETLERQWLWRIAVLNHRNPNAKVFGIDERKPFYVALDQL